MAHEQTREAIKKRLAELEPVKAEKEHLSEYKELTFDLEHEFDQFDSGFVYILHLLGAESYPKLFLQDADLDDYTILSITDDSSMLFYMLKLGIDGKEIYQRIKEFATREGRLSFNTNQHTGALLFYVHFNRDLPETKEGITYWLTHWKEFIATREADASDVAIGLKALIEYDSDLYSKEIEEHKEYLISQQKPDGSFYSIDYTYESLKIRETSEVVSALSLIMDLKSDLLLRAKESLLRYLEKALKQSFIPKTKEDFVPEPIPPQLVLALIDLGAGPKISSIIMERKIRMFEKIIEGSRPIFLVTSPITNSRTLLSKTEEMIKRAQKEILVSSLFINTLYGQIISKKQNNNAISIRVITRAPHESAGDGRKASMQAIELLSGVVDGVRITDRVHSRMLIIDKSEMIVSSADLTSDQLEHFYNAGLYTSDKDAIAGGIDYFERLYHLAKEFKKPS